MTTLPSIFHVRGAPLVFAEEEDSEEDEKGGPDPDPDPGPKLVEVPLRNVVRVEA